MSDSSQFPQLGPRKRLHICTGQPYPAALKDMHTDYANSSDIWYVSEPMDAGDLVLSVVATAPRMIIGLDELERKYTPGKHILMRCVPEKAVVFDHGVLLPAVVKRCGWFNPLPDEGFIEGRRARSFLRELEAEASLGIPWFTPSRWRDIQ